MRTRNRPACREGAAVGTAILILALSPALLPADETRATPDAEDVEWIEDFDVMDAGSGPEVVGFAKFFGRLHILSVHFPIAWVWLAVILALARCRWPGRIGCWDLVILIAAAVSFLPALATGWVHRLNLHSRSDVPLLVERHKMLAFATFAVVVLAVGLRSWAQRTGARRIDRLALIAIGIGAVLVSVTAHLGGSMVFGSDFLRFW